MLNNLGRRAKFFLVKEQRKEISVPNEAQIIPQIVQSSVTPDERRNRLIDFARLTQKEKAA